jgi:hypothetical protein
VLTLAQAFAIADELNAAHGRWGQRACVYALDPAGLTRFVALALRSAPFRARLAMSGSRPARPGHGAGHLRQPALAHPPAGQRPGGTGTRLQGRQAQYRQHRPTTG